MNIDLNPYSSPESVQLSPSRWASRLLPTTKARCLALSLVLWPVVATVTDAIAIPVEPALGIDDLGLAAVNVTLPISWALAIALWFRGFLLERLSVGSVVQAMGTLPLWLVFNLAFFMVNFPLGRISSNF